MLGGSIMCMGCTHVHTHVAKDRHNKRWIVMWCEGGGLGGLMALALLFFCGSWRRISWRFLQSSSF